MRLNDRQARAIREGIHLARTALLVAREMSTNQHLTVTRRNLDALLWRAASRTIGSQTAGSGMLTHQSKHSGSIFIFFPPKPPRSEL